MTSSVRLLIIGGFVGIVVGVVAYFGADPTGRAEISAQTDASAQSAGGAIPQAVSSSDSLSFVDRDLADKAASLARLSGLQNPRERREAALAVLDVLNSDMGDIERIASALPAYDRMNFTFDAIALLADEVPSRAFDLALDLETFSARAEALSRIAAKLVSEDPAYALESAQLIGDYDLADLFKTVVLEDWARVDADGFLEFIGTAKATDVSSSGEAFSIAAQSDSERLLSLIDSIPQNVRSAAQRAALEVLVRENPVSAIAYVDSLPPSNARDSLLGLAAREFALQDLNGALAWLNSRQASEATAMAGVFEVLADVDPVRGADFLVATVATAGSLRALRGVISAFTPGPRDQLSIVADRLSAVDDSAVQIAFGQFIRNWSENDSEGAYNWAMANLSLMDGESTVALAQNLSRSNPGLAKQTADLLPLDKRSLWVNVVVGQLARADINDAVEWVSRYQGQPFYDEAVSSAMRALALSGNASDSRSVAMFLDQQSPQVRASSLPMVAYLYAEDDASAAARWVERIELGDAEPSRRYAAMANVATQWAGRDPDAARDWVLGLPEGEGRDQVLTSLLGVTSSQGFVDPLVLDAFSSSGVRQQRLANLMENLGLSDPDLGRELIDRYVQDPEQRAVAEERLIEGATNPSLVRDTGFGIYN